MEPYFFAPLGAMVLIIYTFGGIFVLYDAFFSFKGKRKRNIHKWDFSEVEFWKDMTKEQFIDTYPVYPGGRSYTGFSVEFDPKESYKVSKITAITNSGVRSIAYNKKQMVKTLKNFS